MNATTEPKAQVQTSEELREAQRNLSDTLETMRRHARRKRMANKAKK